MKMYMCSDFLAEAIGVASLHCGISLTGYATEIGYMSPLRRYFPELRLVKQPKKNYFLKVFCEIYLLLLTNMYKTGYNREANVDAFLFVWF